MVILIFTFTGKGVSELNIYDVSNKAGVSIATVSRVMNGNPNVSDTTRQRVLSVMKELGYTPNIFARGLGLNTMKTIGIMCTDSSDMYLANAVYYTEHELRNHDYDSILCCTGNNLENKKKSLQLLLSKRVDALILVGSKFLEAKLKDNAYIFTAAEQVPIMLVNGYLDGKNIYCTICDDYRAVFHITDALLTSGRKKLLYLYTSNSYSGLQKRKGFLSALKEHGIYAEERTMQLCPKGIYEAKDIVAALYSQGTSFDGVITSDDYLAVGALKYALEHQIQVPDTLSIVGYNNSVLATCAEPELTSIDTKVEALCVNTVNSLMRIFEGNDVPRCTTISATIVYRKTTNLKPY